MPPKYRNALMKNRNSIANVSNAVENLLLALRLSMPGSAVMG